MKFSTKKKYSLCIISEQLAGGGAERYSAVLSQFFESNNCSVHHVVVIDKIEYDYAGKLLNLGKIKSKYRGIFNRIHRFWVLKQFFKKNKFDFIIDTRVKNRQWQEYYITKYIFNAPLIVVVHSYMTELYFPKNQFLAEKIYKKAYKIITVSNLINQKIKSLYPYKQVETIYNSIDFEYIEKQLTINLIIDYKYVLAVGRIQDNIKQFDVLIECYGKSTLLKRNIKLIILGDGSYRSNLEKLVKDLKLEKYVVFEGSVSNPFPYYKEALFTVLTSKNEGFPTVLIESLACGTPIVSFDCLSGPNEIISHKNNGLLIENQNQEQMIEGMNLMVSNNELYLHCKQNAKQSVEKFSIEKIGIQWLELFKELSK